VSKLNDNKTRRPGPSFYLLVGAVLFSAWQYYDIGAVTWPTRVASATDKYVRQTLARVRNLGSEQQIEGGDESGSPRAAKIEAAGPAVSGPRPPNERPSFLSRAQIRRIVDGDSLELDLDGRTTRVRLLCIDAPELGQAYGNAARRFLQSLAAGDTLLVEGQERDTYDRLLAKIYRTDEDTSLNWQMARAGYAWDNTRFTCGEAYTRAERSARSERAGLWQDAAAVPPWEWRRSNGR